MDKIRHVAKSRRTQLGMCQNRMDKRWIQLEIWQNRLKGINLQRNQSEMKKVYKLGEGKHDGKQERIERRKMHSTVDHSRKQLEKKSDSRRCIYATVVNDDNQKEQFTKWPVTGGGRMAVIPKVQPPNWPGSG